MCLSILGLVSQAHNMQGHSRATNNPVTNMAMPNLMGKTNGFPSHFGNNSFNLGNNGSSGAGSNNMDLASIMKNMGDFSKVFGNLAKMGNGGMSPGGMGSNGGRSMQVNGNGAGMSMGNMARTGAMGINGSFNSMHGNANMKMDTGQNMVAGGASNLHNQSGS